MAAGIMVKESRSTVGHVSKVRPINGRAVHLEFKFRMIVGPLWNDIVEEEWYGACRIKSLHLVELAMV